MPKRKGVHRKVQAAIEFDMPIVSNGDGAAGRPFVTPMPNVPGTQARLPHAPDRLPELPHSPAPAAELPRTDRNGLKGGDEEC